MADSDPISEATPAKRRKLDGDGSQTAQGQPWDSEDDNSDGFTVEDFEQATVATVPLSQAQKKLRFTSQQFKEGLSSAGLQRSSSPYITQPTQTLRNGAMQPTPRLSPRYSSSDVQVQRSSPPPETQLPSKPKLPPITHSASLRKGSLLRSAMAPPGTTFRMPVGVQTKQPTTLIDLDSDTESINDPPVNHSSDDEATQGLSSNIKPTNFQKGARGLESSSPKRAQEPVQSSLSRVQESPVSSSGQSNGLFAGLMSQFGHNDNLSKPRKRPADDLASAYGTSSRRPKPPQGARQTGPSRAQPVPIADMAITDIPDYLLQSKVSRMQKSLPGWPISKYLDALSKTKNNEQDAMVWILDHGEDPNEVVEVVNKSKGVATTVSHSSDMTSQSVRPAAKQQIKAPQRSINEKYGPTQAVNSAVERSSPDILESQDAPRPRKRLIQGRRRATSPSLPSSPIVEQDSGLSRRSKQVVTIESDSESDSGVVQSEEPEEPTQSDSEVRLLDFFNSCSLEQLCDLSSQPESVCRLIIEKRPFVSLDAVRIISNISSTTKSGKKSQTRPIGDKVVDVCSDMWTGYDAVDELVKGCEKLGRPIGDALKKWGATSTHGELEMMKIDDAHDSGIGTPTSSWSDEMEPRRAPTLIKKTKGGFLAQPTSMGTKVTLKNYQLVGLNWLNLLWSKKLSCILADDMGLGKTCQVIAFLVHLQEQKTDGVHLVIVPGSTLENWLREFQRFGPSLKVVPYYGSQKERPELQLQIEQQFHEIDVIVTTYDMAVKKDDARFLRHLEPAVCIFDEAQSLRNANSNRYQQLMRIPADFRLLLTGTPVQNNLQELIAILAFIMPELFNDRKDDLEYIFRHKATTKDSDHAALLSAQRIERARTMMTPFILRRKKAQVLELPTKHSRVEYCDMTSRQRELYIKQLQEAQELFSTAAGMKSKASSNIMMALRKAAIHPLLSRSIYTDAKLKRIQAVLLKRDYAGTKPDLLWDYLTGNGYNGIKGGDFALHRECQERASYLGGYMLKHEEWMDSGKVFKFKKLVEQYVKNGDRILVFSQFTMVMDVLEAVLDTMGVKFHRLDGDTKMHIRQDMIDDFAADTSIPVFMLSTKAGGAGINLACANRVVIFDSGFNPQDDIQAENRAHRVGQTREVEVVRLVTRGTIEEQIHKLGESKLALDSRVAGEAASAADEKQVEKDGEKMVQEAFAESLIKEDGKCDGRDLKDAFKQGLEKRGLNVAAP